MLIERKKFFNLFLKLLAVATAFWGLSRFCERQTHGFRPYLILSNLPNDPRWEVPPALSEQEIDRLLDQPFTFLGSGGWCYAFLGQDQKTVLKFYRHIHLLPSSLLKDFSFSKLLLRSDPLPPTASYFQEFNFNSCILLWKKAREYSGLLYIHLNKTHGKHKPVTLIDPIGVHHQIDLDKTEFVVQKKAELILPHLGNLVHERKIEEAKHHLDTMLDCLMTLCKRGIRDHDTSLRNNYGFTEDGAIALDLSSFELDPTLQTPENYQKEMTARTQRLKHWLKKHHPEFYPYFEERFQKCIGKWEIAHHN